MRKWSEMFPNGRHVYYDGDDPKAFVKEMIAKYNFDPSKFNSHWNSISGYGFHLSGEHIDEVYIKYPLGS